MPSLFAQFLPHPSPIDLLPAELLLTILARLSNPDDILSSKMVSRKFHQLINANAVKLPRLFADCAIKQIEKCWEVELSRKGQKKKWQIGGEQQQTEQRHQQQQGQLVDSAVAPSPFWHFEFASIALFGPFSSDGISLLIRLLQFTCQIKIKSVFVENFNFDNVRNTQNLFGQLIRQKCERLHLKNCRFNSLFVHCSLLADHFLHSPHSLAQFRLEDENYERKKEDEQCCLPAHFLLWSLSQLAHSVALRCPRPLSAPFLWDSFFPSASFSDHSAASDHLPTVSDQFLSALATFVLNWQFHPSPPSFRICIRRVPPHFASDFCAFCDRMGISQVHLVFPSLFVHTLRIQCKQNEEKCLFEMFSLRETNLWPTVFCLISEQHQLINGHDQF